MALRDATGRAGVAYDNAELVRAAAELLPTIRSCSPPSGAGWPASTSTSWPTPTRPRSTCCTWSPATARPGRVRRPGLLHVRLPGRRSGRSSGTSRTGSAHPGARRPVHVLTTSHRAGAQLLAARRAGTAPAPAGRSPRAGLRPLPDADRPAPSRCTRSGPLPAKRPTSRTGCARRTCATRCLAPDGGGPALHHARPGRPAARAVPGRRPGHHARRRPAAARPAGGRPLLLALRCGLDPGRLDEAAAVALLHSPLGGADPLANAGCARGCGRSHWPPATGARPGYCSWRRCGTRLNWPPWSAAGPARHRRWPGC